MKISMGTLLAALSALDGATDALLKSPDSNAFNAYLNALQAGGELRRELGLLESVEVETKTASREGLAA